MYIHTRRLANSYDFLLFYPGGEDEQAKRKKIQAIWGRTDVMDMGLQWRNQDLSGVGRQPSGGRQHTFFPNLHEIEII